MDKLLHREKTHRLRGLIFRVRNELGAGWGEEIYHQALVQLLRHERIPVESKPRQPLIHRGMEIHLFEPDLLVWQLIILELKALPYQTQFTGQQYAQLIHYLKLNQMELGLLVNFGPSQVKIKRVIWEEPELGFAEDYDRIKKLLTQEDRTLLAEIRRCIVAVARQFGLGYPETVYRDLLAVEFAHCNLDCQTEVEVPASWQGQSLGTQKTQHLLVAQKYLVHTRSLLDTPTPHDFTRLKTYLTAVDLKIGLVINFGRTLLQIHGVAAT